MALKNQAVNRNNTRRFEHKSDLVQLARQQGVSPVVDFESLADDFITFGRGARRIG
jgi:hypothetical protein